MTHDAAFRRVFVPFDGSPPARAALALAIRLGRRGARLTVAYVVDSVKILAESAASVLVDDPGPVLDELDVEAARLLDDANARCRAARVSVATRLVRDPVVAGIVAAATAEGCDLIVMGTHGRGPFARAFVGSTAVGVVRASAIPVVTLRGDDHLDRDPFGVVLAAIDDSEAADAVLAVAARCAAHGSRVVVCHAVDPRGIRDFVAKSGYPTDALDGRLHDEGRALVRRVLARSALPANTPIVVAEGEPGGALIDAAEGRFATMIVVGSHAAHGLSRIVSGSVAERVMRGSTLPVLVVPNGFVATGTPAPAASTDERGR